jgi:hypothetical protein
MSNSESIALIIPIYHEQDNVVNLLDKIQLQIKIPINIYFIYDDDNDPSIPVINNKKNEYNFTIKLIKNKYNQGALNAIKTGLENFVEQACIIIMADGSDDLTSINGMYGLFCQGFHIVCGSRYMRNGSQIGGQIIKKLMSYFAGISLYHLTTLPTHDATNSFKLYSKEIINTIKIESKGGFEIGIEILVKSHFLNYAITEVPTNWKDRYQGNSKFKLIQWLPSYLKWYFYILIRKPFFIKRKDIKYNTIKPVGY